jgi:hypothetical protein
VVDFKRYSLQHQAYYSIKAIYMAFSINPLLNSTRELKVYEFKHIIGYNGVIKLTLVNMGIVSTNKNSSKLAKTSKLI